MNLTTRHRSLPILLPIMLALGVFVAAVLLWRLGAPAARPSIGTAGIEQQGADLDAKSDGLVGPVDPIEIDAERTRLLMAAAGGTAEGLALAALPEETGAPKLRGRVVAADANSNRPIAGATLTYGPLRADVLEPGESYTTVTTDEHGRFVLPIEAVGRHRLSVTAEGYLSSVSRLGPVNEDWYLRDVTLAPASIVSGRVIDARGKGIEAARILKVDPCADDLRPSAWDVADQVLGVTDAQGAFTVSASARAGPNSSWSIVAVHDEYRPALHQGQPSGGPGELEPILITMQPGALVNGRITGLSPDEIEVFGPLAVAVLPRISLHDFEDDWFDDESVRRVPVEPDGRFVVGGLREGERIALSVWSGGVEKSQLSWRLSKWEVGRASFQSTGSDVVDLEYLRPATVRARVVDQAGRAVENLAVEGTSDAIVISVDGPRPLSKMAVFRGGVVTWQCLALRPDDEWDFGISVEDEAGAETARWYQRTAPVGAGGLYDFGDVMLEAVKPPQHEAPEGPQRTLNLQAVDGSGHPMPGATVELFGGNDLDSRLQSSRSDSAGNVTFEIGADVDCFARVRLQGHRRWVNPHWRKDASFLAAYTATPIPAGYGPLNLEIPTAATADVKISVTYGGAPLIGASLVMTWVPTERLTHHVRHSRDPTPVGVRTDGAGVWAHRGMLPGRWRATVHHPRLRMYELFDFELQPGPNAVALDRQSIAMVGLVVDSGGAPIEGALVCSELGNSSPLYSLHERDNHRMQPRLGGTKGDVALRDIRYVRTDRYGAFRLEGLQPGVAVKAIAAAPGFAPAASPAVLVEPGPAYDLGEIELSGAGRVRVLLPPDMEGNINLEFIPLDPEAEEYDALRSYRWSSIFDEETIDGLPPGTWKASLDYAPSRGSEDSIEHTETVEVRIGETCLIDLRNR